MVHYHIKRCGARAASPPPIEPNSPGAPGAPTRGVIRFLTACSAGHGSGTSFAGAGSGSSESTRTTPFTSRGSRAEAVVLRRPRDRYIHRIVCSRSRSSSSRFDLDPDGPTVGVGRTTNLDVSSRSMGQRIPQPPHPSVSSGTSRTGGSADTRPPHEQ